MQQVKLASGRTRSRTPRRRHCPQASPSTSRGSLVSTISTRRSRRPGVRRERPPTQSSIRPTGAVAIRPDLRPHVVTGGPQPCAAATDEQSSFDDKSRSTAWRSGIRSDRRRRPPPRTASRRYMKPAISAGPDDCNVRAEPYDPTDIATYQPCYGTSVPITNVAVASAPVTCTNPCPRMATARRRSTSNRRSGSLRTPASGVHGTGRVSSISTSSARSCPRTGRRRSRARSAPARQRPEATSKTGENTLLEEAATQGQAFFASSGDSGAETCSQMGTGNFSLSVEDPSAQPFATGVGGTSLPSYGAPLTEGVWNDGANPECNCTNNEIGGGTGGGISDLWPMPSYQSGAPAVLGVINADSSATPCGGGTVDCREDPGRLGRRRPGDRLRDPRRRQLDRGRRHERLDTIMGRVSGAGERILGMPRPGHRIREPGALPDRRPQLRGQLQRHHRGEPVHRAR